MIRYHKLAPQNVVICPNIFDFKRIQELAQEVGPEFVSDRFHIVCVGRLQCEKGQIILLQAVEQLVRRNPQTKVLVWLVGSGPDESDLQQYVGDHSLASFVRFAGFQANPLPYVRQASVVCLPSLFEGMPNALVEAMACGTPVIAADCASGPREILVDGQFGQLVPPGNPLALSNAIEDATHNDRREQAEAGRRHVEQTYSVDKGLERLQSIVEEVAATDRQV